MNKLFFLTTNRAAIAEGPLAIPANLDRPGVNFSNFRHALDKGGAPSAAAVKALQQTGGRLVAQPEHNADAQTITDTAELFGVDGDIVWAPRNLTAEEIAELLTQAISQAQMDIDGAAIGVDEKYTTTGGQQGAIYQLKLEQVDAWKEAQTEHDADPETFPAPNIDAPAFGLIKAEQTALQVANPDTTPAEAVASIDVTRTVWTEQIAPARESIRRAGKEQAKAATTSAEARQASAGAVAALQAI